MQADMVLEEELRTSHLNLKVARNFIPQTARRRLSLPHWAELEHRTSKPTPTVTYILQQGHTYSNKTTFPNTF